MITRWLNGKESACHCERHQFDPGLGRSPGEGNGNPLQYSWLESFTDRGVWWVREVTQSWTRLSARTHTQEVWFSLQLDADRHSLRAGWKCCPEFQVRNSPWTLSTYAKAIQAFLVWFKHNPYLVGAAYLPFWRKARTQGSESVSRPVVSSVRLFTTPCTVAHQAPLSTGFPMQEYWSGLPFPSLLQGIFPTQGSNPGLPHCRQILYCLSHRDLSP